MQELSKCDCQTRRERNKKYLKEEKNEKWTDNQRQHQQPYPYGTVTASQKHELCEQQIEPSVEEEKIYCFSRGLCHFSESENASRVDLIEFQLSIAPIYTNGKDN